MKHITILLEIHLFQNSRSLLFFFFFFIRTRHPPISTLFPYAPLSRFGAPPRARGARGMAGADIFVPAIRVADLVLSKGAGLIDRSDDRPGLRIRRLPGVNGPRL